MKKHNQESVKLGGPDKDSELNRLSSLSYQNNLEFNSKIKFFSFQITANEHNTTTTKKWEIFENSMILFERKIFSEPMIKDL